MKPANKAVMDGIAECINELLPEQQAVLLRAMKNPYFYLISFRLARADERLSRIAYLFVSALTDSGSREGNT